MFYNSRRRTLLHKNHSQLEKHLRNKEGGLMVYVPQPGTSDALTSWSRRARTEIDDGNMPSGVRQLKSARRKAPSHPANYPTMEDIAVAAAEGERHLEACRLADVERAIQAKRDEQHAQLKAAFGGPDFLSHGGSPRGTTTTGATPRIQRRRAASPKDDDDVGRCLTEWELATAHHAATHQKEEEERLARLESILGGLPVVVSPLRESLVCDYCIVLTGEDSIKRHLKPIVAVLAGTRFRVCGGQHTHHGPCGCSVFEVEVCPFCAPASRVASVSIHVTVLASAAQDFYRHQLRRLNAKGTLGIDPSYPSSTSRLTDAQRKRILASVMNDVVYVLARVPSKAKVALFPSHVDELRDALWQTTLGLERWTNVLRPAFLLRFFAFAANEDAIAHYFGPEVMFYFAWMYHYQRWLLGGAVASVGVMVMDHLCGYATGESPCAGIFSAVMVLWGVLGIKWWERRCSVLSMRQQLFQSGMSLDASATSSVGESGMERMHEFVGRPGYDPITGKKTHLYPSWRRAVLLQPLSWICVAAFVVMSVGLAVVSLNVESLVEDGAWIEVPLLHHLAKPGALFDAHDHPWMSMVPGVLYSMLLQLLSTSFTVMAHRLTLWENYRYRAEYMRAMILKRVVFDLLNGNIKLIYLAVVRRDVQELAVCLTYIFSVSAAMRFFTSTVLPFFNTHRSRMMSSTQASTAAHVVGGVSPAPVEPGAASRPSLSAGSSQARHGGSSTSALDEVDEMLDDYEVFFDYVEMATQLTQILFFSFVFPAAALIALVTNMVEMRADLFKLCYIVRRPVPRIGLLETSTWCSIFRYLVYAAVVVNTAILGFASFQKQLRLLGVEEAEDEATVASMKVHVGLYFVLLEHGLLALSAFLFWRIPSTPLEVRIYQQRKMAERLSKSA